MLGIVEQLDRSSNKVYLREATDHDERMVMGLIRKVDNSFVPAISARVSLDGYYRYMLGRNPEYLAEKYGPRVLKPYKPRMILAQNSDGHLLGLTSYFEYFEPFKGGYVIALMTDPHMQQGGIGSMLMGAAVEDLQQAGVRQASVTTWSTNEGSQKVIRRHGFETYKTVENERGPGIHGMYFRRLLH